MRPEGPRPTIIGADTGPEPPFPLRMEGKVVVGFGRGSKELGIPTANIPVDTTPWIDTIKSGVYFGWSSLELPADQQSQQSHPTAPPPSSANPNIRLYPMVMSIGYNPFYKNKVRSAEVHILHDFEKDFYGAYMRLEILGFIRPEYDYVSKESLVEDIKFDVSVAGKSLEREAWGVKGTWIWGVEEGEGEKKGE